MFLFYYFNLLFHSFVNIGSGIVGFIVDGIKSIGNLPYDSLVSVLNPIANLLPHSPAKEGPLSVPINWISYINDPLDASIAKLGVQTAQMTSTVAVMKKNISEAMTSLKDAISSVKTLTLLDS